MLRIAIVEDDPMYVGQIQDFLKRFQEEKGKDFKITVFQDGEDIVEHYRCEFDLILMDVQMRFMDGMTAAEHIRKLDESVLIMFITNMAGYAIKGYEVNATDYILKPVEYFAFSQKLEKALDKIKKKDDIFITIPIEDGILKLNILELYYVESQGHMVRYNTAKGVYSARKALKELEKTLEKYDFYRCSKGFLVNMNQVEGVVAGECLVNGERLPISRGLKKEFMDKLMQLMRE